MAKKVSHPVMLAPESLEKIRDAAFWAEGETISSLCEKGALDLISRMEKERGEPFPRREGEVRTGRPKKEMYNEAIYQLTDDYQFHGGIVVKKGTGVRRGRPDVLNHPDHGEMWPCIWDGARTGNIPTKFLKRIG